ELVFVFEAGREGRAAHVERLPEIADLPELVDLCAVHGKVDVEEAEARQDLVDLARPTRGIGAGEQRLRSTEWVRSGQDADHAVGDGDAGIAGRIDLRGFDRPAWIALRRCACGQAAADREHGREAESSESTQSHSIFPRSTTPPIITSDGRPSG